MYRNVWVTHHSYSETHIIHVLFIRLLLSAFVSLHNSPHDDRFATNILVAQEILHGIFCCNLVSNCRQQQNGWLCGRWTLHLQIRQKSSAYDRRYYRFFLLWSVAIAAIQTQSRSVMDLHWLRVRIMARVRGEVVFEIRLRANYFEYNMKSSHYHANYKTMGKLDAAKVKENDSIHVVGDVLWYVRLFRWWVYVIINVFGNNTGKSFLHEVCRL